MLAVWAASGAQFVDGALKPAFHHQTLRAVWEWRSRKADKETYRRYRKTMIWVAVHSVPLEPHTIKPYYVLLYMHATGSFVYLAPFALVVFYAHLCHRQLRVLGRMPSTNSFFVGFVARRQQLLRLWCALSSVAEHPFYAPTKR